MRIPGRSLFATRSRTIANATVLSVASAALVVVAATSDGYKATNVDLDDGAVWVVDASRQQMGRLNRVIDQVDVVLPTGEGPDILQDGRTVVLGDAGGMAWIQVETAERSTARSDAPLERLRYGGPTMALLEPDEGLLWTGQSVGLIAAEYPEGAVGRVAPGSLIEVTASGRVIVVDPAVPEWYEVELDVNGLPVRPVEETPETTDAAGEAAVSTTEPADEGETEEGTEEGADEDEVPIIEPAERVAIPRDIPADVRSTVVGEDVVLLTSDGDVVLLDGSSVTIDDTDLVLQQRGGPAEEVLVAGSDGLHAVDLDTAEARVVVDGQPGLPAAPVRVGSCVYGLWGGGGASPPTWYRGCGGDEGRVREVTGGAPGTPLVYRVNKNNLAINSFGDGRTWAVHDDRLVDIGDWGDERGELSDEESPDEESALDELADEQCQRDGTNIAPQANDDEGVGVRSNRQTLVDVLANDSDSNCDPISIDPASVQYDPSVGTFEVVDDGQRLLFTPSAETLKADRPFDTELSYSVVDALSLPSPGPATARIRLAPAVDGEDPDNRAPELRTDAEGETRPQRTTVESGETIGFDVLADWWDPDGDDISLQSASAAQGIGEVSFSPLGTLRYNTAGVGAGVYELQVLVSDGRRTASGSIEVTVQAEGTPIEPEALDDFVTVTVGESAVVRPLANDSDPNGLGEQLNAVFGALDQFTGVQLAYDGVVDALTVTGVEQGIYAVPYELTDSDGGRAPATVQVRVIAPEADPVPPVAVPDRVVLRPGRVVNVDVLDNDVDPNGDLLAVVGTDDTLVDPATGGVRVSVVDRRFLQVELVRPLDGSAMSGPYVVGYQISDGFVGDVSHTATGQLVVMVDGTQNDRPPVTTNDRVTVRTGEVMAVDVVENDFDPDGDELVLERLNQQGVLLAQDADEFVAWVDGSRVVVRGGLPGSYEIFYEVVANGAPVSGQLQIEVTEPPSETSPNQPPQPEDIEVRVARGASVRIPVELNGIDRDGDITSLVGPGPTLAPTSSTVVIDDGDPSVLIYSVDKRSSIGEDAFEYTVRDPYGEVGVARVRVVVVDVPGSPPVAVDDVIRARPGRVLELPVLANDVDADDDPIELAAPPFMDEQGQPTETPLNPDAVEAFADEDADALRGGAIRVTTPPVSEGTLAERYRITDGTGTNWAYVQVIPDPDAPNTPPITEGWTVQSSDVVGKVPGDRIEVEVASRSFDPDDAEGALTYRVPPGQPGVDAVPAAGSVSIALTAAPQVVVYSVTDADPVAPATAYGVIRVPGVEQNLPPELRDTAAAGFDLAADAADPLRFTVDQLVVDPEGDPGLRLTATPIVFPSGGVLVERTDDDLGFEVTADPGVTAAFDATVTFEVEDRPGDPLNNAVPLSIVIRVTPPEVINNPPYLLGDGAVSVPVFEEPVQFDLGPLVRDDEGDRIEFSAVSSSAGIDVVQNDSVITITGNDEMTPIGTVIPISFRFNDNVDDHEPLPGVVRVTITPTNRAAPIAANLTVEAIRDQAAAPQDVISAATNIGGFDLEIVSVNVSGGGSVTCTANCGTQPIVFTPVEPGSWRVDYTLRELTSQPRVTTGSITYNVKGLPRAPGTPTIVSVGDQRVNLTWSPANMQGGEFREYVVRVVETGQEQTTTGTAHEFTGLENDRTYRFVVFARNEVPGDGELSGQSNGARPDTVPDAPVNARFVDYGNGVLYLAWDPPATANTGRYSAIIDYQIELSGFGPIVVGSPQLQWTQTGLTNGTDYTFRVRARNNADANGGWGEYSPWSATERPSTAPSAPASVTATPAGDGGQARVQVTWPQPADGGRAIVDYEVCATPAAGSPALTCQTANASRTTTFVVTPGSSYTFRVRARNTDRHTPVGPDSPASNVFTGIVLPGAPNLTAVTVGDHTLTAVATPGANGGCTGAVMEFSRDGTNWQTSATFPGLTNGQTYTIQARMRLATVCVQYLEASLRGSPYNLAPNPSRQAIPLGPLRTPQISAVASGTSITYTWNAAQGDNGRNWTGTISGECSASFGPGNPTGSCQINPGYNSGPRTVVITVSADGQSLNNSAAAATGNPPPPPTMTVVTPSGGTCPEPNFSSPSNWNGGACNGDTGGTGYGFSRSQTVVVDCKVFPHSSWIYPTWVRVQSGGPPVGWFLALGTVTVQSGNIDAIPNC